MIFNFPFYSLLIGLCILASLESMGQSDNLNESDAVVNSLAPGYYLVVGAFAYKRNAFRYHRHLKDNGHSPEIGLNNENDLHYVYLSHLNKAGNSSQVEILKDKVLHMRETKEFYDAWLYKKGVSGEPEKPLKNSSAKSTVPISEENKKPRAVEDLKETTEIEAEKPTEEKDPQYHYYNIYFNVVRADTHKEVDGKIEAFDSERGRNIGEFASNQLHTLKLSRNRDHKMQFVAEIFGYRKIQHEIDLKNPGTASGETIIEKSGDTLIVNFELNRYRKGDISTTYKILFYNDAAVMKPESQPELNALTSLLKENKDYKLLITGHTNGKAKGKIISPDPDDPDFFSLSGNTLEDYGSAKKLSKERALTIKKYLVLKGIDPDRLEVKGRGGKDMLYDQFDPLAYLNLRVEIEILDD